jgi:hypothetical protein
MLVIPACSLVLQMPVQELMLCFRCVVNLNELLWAAQATLFFPTMSWDCSLIPVDALCHTCLFGFGLSAYVFASALIRIIFPVMWVGTVECLAHSVLTTGVSYKRWAKP